MKIDRTFRLRAVWLLVVPFFLFARPTPTLLLAGGILAALGLLIRASAAGFIHKDRILTVTGPYAYTRNPLYLGSFLLGLGITVAGGHWFFVVAFLLFFGVVYRHTIRHEAEELEKAFGGEYRAYANGVPLFLPRLTPWRSAETEPAESSVASPSRFSAARWKRNREYEALLGAAAGFAGLIVRMVVF